MRSQAQLQVGKIDVEAGATLANDTTWSFYIGFGNRSQYSPFTKDKKPEKEETESDRALRAAV